MNMSPFLQTHKKVSISLIFIFLCCIIHPVIAQQTWKAGTAKLNITPKQPLLMAGYSSRTHPAEGTLSELWVKSLVLQDASGKIGVMVSSDLLGFPKSVSDRIREKVGSDLGISKSQIILNSSHTHSGPIIGDALQDIYPLDSTSKLAIKIYTHQLEKDIIASVMKAYRAMEPVKIYAQQSVSRFQVNRRNNIENKLAEQTELKGPNDFSVPVFKVEDLKKNTKAILFGYACHATVLNGYEWSGDYPGYAQSELETSYPGATAMFFQGAGGDQNPLPRKKVSLAKKYGQELALAVKSVLEEPMDELVPELKTAYSEINLEFIPLAEEEMTKMAETGDNYMQKWAKRMLAKSEQEKTNPMHYPYPVQAWKIGKQNLITLGGEVTIGYAIQIKKMLGKDTFVMAYSNDVMGYIPSSTILNEGGYEGYSSQMVYGLPGKWRETIESNILKDVNKTASEIGIKILEN